MADKEDQLRETLDELHQQLSDAENLDEDLARRLRTTLSEIQAKLDEKRLPSESTEHTDPLSETVSHFRQSHPTLADTITRLIDTLGQVGI